MRYFLPVLIVGSLTLSACIKPAPLGPLPAAEGPTSQVQLATGELPSPQAEDYVSRDGSYLIGPSDVLEIGVYGVEGLEAREYRIDGSGRVSFPLVGTISAAGMTPTELEQRLTQALQASYIRNPQVTVNLREARSKVVTVSGEVERPGLYPATGDLTLIRAVASAGGLGEFAKQDEVIVLRDVGGQRFAGVYNLGAIQRGNYDDPEIYANDVIIVGNSAQRRLIRDLIGGAPAIIAPLLVTLTNSN